MPLKLHYGNIITPQFQVTAVVNSANPEPEIIGSGVETEIYNAAGYEELLKLRKEIGSIGPGQARLSGACNMHNINGARYVIHTVATPWVGGDNNEEEVLKSCYLECLKLVRGKKIKSVAFPLLGAGTYGYKPETAFEIAVKTISNWLEHNAYCNVYLVTIDPKVKVEFENYVNSNPGAFLEDKYIESNSAEYIKNHYDESLEYYEHETEQIDRLKNAFKNKQKKQKLSARQFLTVNSTTPDVASTLILLMEKYNVTSSLFFDEMKINSSYYGKIINRENKSVQKETLMEMGFVMKLTEEDFNKLLASGGYTLNLSNKTDILALWCIRNQIFDLKKEVPAIYSENKVDTFFKNKSEPSKKS